MCSERPVEDAMHNALKCTKVNLQWSIVVEQCKSQFAPPTVLQAFDSSHKQPLAWFYWLSPNSFHSDILSTFIRVFPIFYFILCHPPKHFMLFGCQVMWGLFWYVCLWSFEQVLMIYTLVLSLKPFEERCMYILYSVHCTPCSVYRVE